MTDIALRPYLPSDAALLAAIYAASIEELTQEDYDEDQRLAWISVLEDGDAFIKRLSEQLTILAIVEGETTDKAINALRQQQHRNFLTTLLLSSGVPMITAGDEHGRTQQGNNNAYCQDGPISWVDWNIKGDRADLLDTTRTLMKLRAEHPAFHNRNYRWGTPTAAGGPKDLAWFGADGEELDDHTWGDTERRTLGMFINQNTLNGDESSSHSFMIILHSGAEPIDFTMPASQWAHEWLIDIDTTQPGAKSPEVRVKAGDTFKVFARSTLVLHAIND